MKKICILIPYFGSFPKTFEYWLLSASKNPSIDFFIFTDQEIVENKYNDFSNIKFIKMEKAGMINLIKNTINLYLPNLLPYKLCDLRPAFGEIFNDYVSGYDFWGFCDVDVVFGNIRKFITDDLLKKYEKISCFGHFQLFKNNYKINHIYKKIKNYDSIVSSSASFAADELFFSKVCRSLGVKEFVSRTFFCDVDYLHYSFRNAHISCDDIGYFIFHWENGKLIAKTKTKEIELLYCHLQKRNLSIPNKILKESFYIVPNEIVDSCDSPKYRSFKPIYFVNHYIDMRIKRYKNGKKCRGAIQKYE